MAAIREDRVRGRGEDRGAADHLGHHAELQRPGGVAGRVLRRLRGGRWGRQPSIDHLGFHWYDYGIADQLNRLDKYDKPIWLTEFANWHSQNDGVQVTTLAEQDAQMTSMVATLERRSDVFRYVWFTGRVSPDPHYSSLLGATGQLTGLGQLYLSLPH